MTVLIAMLTGMKDSDQTPRHIPLGLMRVRESGDPDSLPQGIRGEKGAVFVCLAHWINFIPSGNRVFVNNKYLYFVLFVI